ncbi:NHLP leader peptide family RiPP precursor [Aneurinibacillus migulanus]|uniref:NHLP leader peptide family RiPP precursor n=1 Tax=Aneurinibacillus migulanus TaxID=47500 RepID=UPI00128F9F20|nr:NHLP leader peptide family RiPP precursor [Aneurinibacillus migulanus]
MKQFQDKASTDAEFRKIALESPSSAVKQVIGVDLPEGFKLQVVDNAGAHLTVVLPDLKGNEYELDETELQNVAGGYMLLYADDDGMPVYSKAKK